MKMALLLSSSWPYFLGGPCFMRSFAQVHSSPNSYKNGLFEWFEGKKSGYLTERVDSKSRNLVRYRFITLQQFYHTSFISLLVNLVQIILLLHAIQQIYLRKGLLLQVIVLDLLKAEFYLLVQALWNHIVLPLRVGDGPEHSLLLAHLVVAHVHVDVVGHLHWDSVAFHEWFLWGGSELEKFLKRRFNFIIILWRSMI